jgi:copper resistance protein C
MISSFPFRRFGAAVAAIVSLMLVLASPGAVLAHAELETATPADGATLTEPPTEIVLTFSEVLDPAKSSIVVALVGGGEVASGGSVDTTGDATRMTLALPPLEAGEYEIRWTSASAVDGDLDRGTTMFSYAPPPETPSPTANATSSPTPPASPASSPTPAPSPTPSADGSAAGSTDVIIPIVAAIVVLAALGGWLLSRSRGRGPA